MSDDETPIKVNLPFEPGTMELHPDFGDTQSMWNMRKWLQKALEAQGAKQIGAGMGMGEADIDIELEGHRYNVNIKPILRNVK